MVTSNSIFDVNPSPPSSFDVSCVPDASNNFKYVSVSYAEDVISFVSSVIVPPASAVTIK